MSLRLYTGKARYRRRRLKPAPIPTHLESWLGRAFFSTAYMTLAVALLFGGLLPLLAFRQGSVHRFLSLRCSTVTVLERGALACFYECMDSVSDFADVLAFSSWAKQMLQILLVV